MSNFYKLNESSENNGYDINYGYDIDNAVFDENKNLLSPEAAGTYTGEKWGDYDVLSNPVSSGGIDSNIVVFPEDSGRIPTSNDYLRTSDDESKQAVRAMERGDETYYLKSMLASDQEGSLEIMTDTINNGRVSDVGEVNDLIIDENVDIIINKDNKENSIKGLVEQNAVNDIFFSDSNTKVLQDTIRYNIYKSTNQSISEQSPRELFIVMRSILLQSANLFPSAEKVVDEIKRINKLVVDYCVGNISSNLKQYNVYIDDLTKLPTPIELPKYENRGNYTYDISNLL